MIPNRTTLILGAALIVIASPSLAAGQPAPSHSVDGASGVSVLARSAAGKARPEREAETDRDTISYFSRSDAWYWLGAGAIIGGAMALDQRLEVPRRQFGKYPLRDFTHVIRSFGDPRALGPPLVASYLAGRIFHRRALSGASARIAGSLFAAGVVTSSLKRATGRFRPREAPDDPRRFEPFSSHDAFPSGHATEAFAAASAIDRETTARWVPWVVYPLAAGVAWARVNESSHWSSDVVAGAAVGWWVGRRTDMILRAHRVGEPGGFLGSLRPYLVPQDGGVGAAFAATF